MKLLPTEQNVEVILKYVKKKFDDNKNFLNLTTGGTGSGKSYVDLRFCEIWYDYYFHEDFPVDKNVCFSIEKIMKRFISGELRKGEIVILEEAGTLINSKDFQSKINKLFNFYMQSFRCKNVGLMFNLPFASMLDKSTRMLAHSHFITREIIKSEKLCEIKPYFWQINQYTGKVYPKYLRKAIKVGNYYAKQRIKSARLYLPSANMLKTYEYEKNLYVNQLGTEVFDEITKWKRNKGLKPLTSFQERLLTAIKAEPGLKQIDYARKLGEIPSLVSYNVQFMENKGYNVRELLGK